MLGFDIYPANLDFRPAVLLPQAQYQLKKRDFDCFSYFRFSLSSNFSSRIHSLFSKDCSVCFSLPMTISTKHLKFCQEIKGLCHGIQNQSLMLSSGLLKYIAFFRFAICSSIVFSKYSLT